MSRSGCRSDRYHGNAVTINVSRTTEQNRVWVSLWLWGWNERRLHWSSTSRENVKCYWDEKLDLVSLKTEVQISAYSECLKLLYRVHFSSRLINLSSQMKCFGSDRCVSGLAPSRRQNDSYMKALVSWCGYLTLRVQRGCVELHSQLFINSVVPSFQSLEVLSVTALGPCDWMSGECGWSFRVFNLWRGSIVYVVSFLRVF